MNAGNFIILNRFDLDLESIEVQIIDVIDNGFFNLYYLSDGSRVTKEVLWNK